ncbi:hypothetical protein D3C78_1643390 [compost metagenome]
MKLLGSVPQEKVVVRERLQASCLSNRQASTLPRVIVDEVVSIFGYMASDSSRRYTRALNPETIAELAGFPVFVIRF